MIRFGEQGGELKRGQGKPNENFVREKGAKDRFGNQYLSSKEFSYFDNTGQETSAGILISPEGQKFIGKNPRILHDIEKGLVDFETNFKKVPNSTIDLGQGRSLQATTFGDQSHLYVLRVDEKKYAVKTHVTPEAFREKISQPYINEMLQTQAIATDLKDDLEKLGVKMSNFFFASGQVSCTEYEENDGLYSAVTEQRLTNLFSMVGKYIKTKQTAHDPLWNNVEVDLRGNLETILRNFRAQKDGTLVWIDPFVFYR